MLLFSGPERLRSVLMGNPWGSILRSLRLQKQRDTGERWPKKRVAHAAGMTATTYGRIEAGGHTTTRQLADLARVFNVPLEALFHGHKKRATDREISLPPSDESVIPIAPLASVAKQDTEPRGDIGAADVKVLKPDTDLIAFANLLVRAAASIRASARRRDHGVQRAVPPAAETRPRRRTGRDGDP